MEESIKQLEDKITGLLVVFTIGLGIAVCLELYNVLTLNDIKEELVKIRQEQLSNADTKMIGEVNPDNGKIQLPARK